MISCSSIFDDLIKVSLTDFSISFSSSDLFLDTVTIEMLKHYAEDAGKSEEEIAQITKPSYDMGFTADGVIIAE